MQEQSSPAPTGSRGLTSAPTSRTPKYKSMKIPGWIFAIALILHGLISIFQNSLKNAPFPFEYEFLNILAFSILSVIFIIYMLILWNNSKSKSEKFIEYLLKDLKYLTFPAGFIFASLPILNLKFINDYVGFISASLGIFGVMQKPSNNHISIVQNISSDPQSQRHERTRLLVDNLRSENYYSKINAIQGLASIADEWLSDSNIPEEQAHKNGQNIINILCEYVRSPFPLAQKAIILSADTPPTDYAGDFFTDQATFREEQEVRRTVFTEMSKRCSSPESKVEGGKASLSPATWSKFDFNFNRAPIFYPLNNITLENTNFSEAKFYNAEFSNLFFNGDTRFDSAVFEGKSDFTYISFNGNINLDNSEFTGETIFKHINFSQNLSCIGGTFHGGLKIKDSSIIGDAYFNDSTFEFLEVLDTTFRKKADFTASESQTLHFDRTIFYNEAIFKKMTFGLSLLQLVTFQNSANFQDVTFTDIASFSSTKFKNNTNFMNAEFYKSANFNYITFTGPAYFINSTFNDAANFSGTTFKDESSFTEINFYGDANFEGSTFVGNTSFNKSLFDKKADFTSSNFRGKSDFIKTTYNQGVSFINSQFAASPPLFSGYIYNNTKEDWFNYESIFSELVDPKNYIFDISPESQQKLETKKIRFNEKIFVLPVGGDLYDPECPPLWDDEDIY